MAEVVRNRVNLLGLYQKSFGFIGVPFPNASVKAYVPNQDTLDSLKKIVNGSSIMGNPLFMPISLGDYQLPNTPLVSARGSNTIIETKIDGARGTFKQLWSEDDWNITIQGICIDEDNPDEYPETQVRELRRLKEEKESLIVRNDLTTILGIERLAIYSVDIPAEAGAETYQKYTIRAKSDFLYELELKEGEI